MFTLVFVPPRTNVGVLGFFWSLFREITLRCPGATCVAPENFVYPKAAGWIKEAGLSIAHAIDRERTGLQFVYADEKIRDVPARSSLICIGVSPTLEDIAHAREWRSFFLNHGISGEQILMLLFQSGMPGAIPSQVIEEQIGPLSAVFSYDPHLFVRAENEAATVQALKPGSAAAEALRRLSTELLAKGASFATEDGVGEEKQNVWAQVLEKKAVGQIWEALGRVDGLRVKSTVHLESLIENEFSRALLSVNGVHAKETIDAVRQNVKDHVMGLGPLQKIMRDPLITEIMVNGETDIYVEREGRIQKTDESFSSRAQLAAVIDRVVSGGGRRVDVSSPLCDVRLADGSRVNVVLPPVSLGGPLLTIRRFRENLLLLEDLEKKGTLTRAQADELKKNVREHQNIVIAGNSGSGKTTLLNILSAFIDPAERIITIEDSAELRLQQPHVVRLETRPQNADSVGAICVSDLVINALRMRPDRLVIGECRGAEVIPMLQAMNTGHDGSMTTVHANSARDALNRLESMVLMGAPQWPIDVVREQIRSAIDVIVYLKRAGAERKLIEVFHLEGSA